MNTNSPKKSEQPANAPDLPTSSLASAQSAGIPPGLESLVGKTPSQLLPELLPGAKNLQGLAAMFAASGLDIGIAVPEWAKNAARRMLEGAGMDFIEAEGELQMSAVGKLVGLQELCPPPEDERLRFERTEKMFRDFCTYAKFQAANAPAQESKEFFDGRASASKTAKRMLNLPQRAKILTAIAFGWAAIDEMESAGQLHRWLIEREIISRWTEPAETRRVCRLIGLRFAGKPGRRPGKK